MTINIHSVQVGQIASLRPRLVLSGFVRYSVSRRGEVTEIGLAGDEQADLSVHDGPEKAAYAYAMH
jgi:MOSC domain-containing protein YiiM